MNIIELLDQQYLNKTTASASNEIDFAAVLHQLEVEKITNSMVDTALLSQLIEVIKNYKEELQFVVNNRILFNFFTKKDLPTNSFPADNISVSDDRIKLFIGTFLYQDLDLYLDQCISQHNFEELNRFMTVQKYFPENSNAFLLEKTYTKMDFAIEILSIANTDLSKVQFVKKISFYDFLSHFRSPELDEKVELLLDKVLSIFAVNRQSEFAGSTIVSMYNYNPVGTELLEKIKKNRNVVYDERTSSGGPTTKYPWKTIVIGLIILVRLAFFVIKVSSDNSRNRYDTYDNQESVDTLITEEPPKTLDPYYVNMQRKIDSFQTFLVGYNKDEIQYAKFNDTIQTGDNPFENVYKNSSLPSNGSPVFFKNKTKYDVILFENPLAFDSIKMPGRAYFIKSGSTYKLDDVPLQMKRVYNFYIGKKLASFVTKSNHIFVRNQSIMEPRFTQLLPDSKAILKQDYHFDSNVVIKDNKGKIEITSD